jgi:hypothetical protein
MFLPRVSEPCSRPLRPSALVPLGLVVENPTCDGATKVINRPPCEQAVSLPGCGTSSRRQLGPGGSAGTPLGSRCSPA